MVGFCGGSGVDGHFGGALSWPLKRLPTGLPERSKQRRLSVSVTIRYLRMMMLPPRRRPGAGGVLALLDTDCLRRFCRVSELLVDVMEYEREPSRRSPAGSG